MAHNVSIVEQGDKIIITIDVSAKALASAPLSSTGKSFLVATTSGLKRVLSLPYMINLNFIATRRNEYQHDAI